MNLEDSYRVFVLVNCAIVFAWSCLIVVSFPSGVTIGLAFDTYSAGRQVDERRDRADGILIEQNCFIL